MADPRPEEVGRVLVSVLRAALEPEEGWYLAPTSADQADEAAELLARAVLDAAIWPEQEARQ